MVYVSGSVGPEVATLELHHQDGYVMELPLVERFVLHDIPRARFEDGGVRICSSHETAMGRRSPGRRSAKGCS
jgi:hypothetical protein